MKKDVAIQTVPPSVIPPDCFITTDDGIAWRPINGTGCAHFVAHELNIKRGLRGGNACTKGYPVSVRLLLEGSAHVESPNDARVNDMWFNDEVFWPQRGKDHCGLVSEIRFLSARDSADFPTIMIAHCSSRQGGACIDDWEHHFNKQGRFYRRVGPERMVVN